VMLLPFGALMYVTALANVAMMCNSNIKSQANRLGNEWIGFYPCKQYSFRVYSPLRHGYMATPLGGYQAVLPSWSPCH